eukprot:TRINITY_DN15987_c0_g1_i1.p1 TRINITY_DN15987_c0_g1~~TRINITY_DN15987_c0_g1_i1.p1  ORF type:complete len:326 (-),score=80.51 TRINITY_DN15987_c0_g1_i1:40-966(-)
MEAKQWREANKLISISQKNATDPEYNYQLKLCKIICCIQMRWFDHILTELQQLRDINIIESSKIPFALKLVDAECLSYFKKNYNICVEKLSQLLSYVNKNLSIENISKEENELWLKRKQRVEFSLANQFIFQNDYNAAISIIKDIISRNDNKEEEKYLVSLLSRIYIQAGNLKMAGKLNRYVEKQINKQNKELTTQDKILILNNNAVYEFHKGDYQKSAEFYEKALELDSKNMILVNNYSLSKLNVCELNPSMKVLEKFLFDDPKNNLEEVLLQNVSVLYELSFENSQDKKKELNNLIRKHSNSDLSF